MEGERTSQRAVSPFGAAAEPVTEAEWDNLLTRERLDAVLTEIEPSPESVPLLCMALEEPWSETREAAARKLARCGDARARGPLTRALRETTGGRWAGLQRAGVGVSILLFCLVLAVAGMLLTRDYSAWVPAGIGLLLLSIVLREFLQNRSERSRLRAALSEALAAIAEREGAPEIRESLPDLRALASDVLQQDAPSREACRAAAERIDRATREIKTLPIAAKIPDAEVAALPRPATADPASEEGPRVRA